MQGTWRGRVYLYHSGKGGTAVISDMNIEMRMEVLGVKLRGCYAVQDNPNTISEQDHECYLSIICFANWVRQESELFNLFLSNKVSNSKE